MSIHMRSPVSAPSSSSSSITPTTSTIATASYESLASKIPKLTKAELETRDCFGNCLIHHIAKTDRSDLLRFYFKNKNIDLNIQDLENGWNCLHIAIFNKNFRIANLIIQFASVQQHKLEALLKQKDREGFTPLDLLSSELEFNKYVQSFNSTSHIESASPHLKNKYKLKRNDSIDYRIPHGVPRCENLLMLTENNEDSILKLSIPQFDSDSYYSNNHNNDIGLKSVQLTSTNCFITTTGEENKLYQFSNFKQDFITMDKCQELDCFSITSTDTYSLIVTTDHEIYGLGSNEYGCLGASIPLRAEQTSPVLVSRPQSAAVLKICCSHVHAVAYSNTKLWFWGLNIGQMGFASTSSDLSNVKYQSMTGPIQRTPFELSFNYDDIKQVACTETATLVLTATDFMHLYTQGWHAKFQLPIYNNPVGSLLYVFKPAVHTERIYVVKMVASKKGKVALLYNNGNILEFALPSENRKLQNSAEFVQSHLKFQNLWKASKKHLKCVDFDMSDDGSIVICTADGSVYCSSRRPPQQQQQKKKRLYKFNKVSNVNNIYQVATDPKFRKFVFSKKRILPFTIRPKTEEYENKNTTVQIKPDQDFGRDSLRLIDETEGWVKTVPKSLICYTCPLLRKLLDNKSNTLESSTSQGQQTAVKTVRKDEDSESTLVFAGISEVAVDQFLQNLYFQKQEYPVSSKDAIEFKQLCDLLQSWPLSSTKAADRLCDSIKSDYCDTAIYCSDNKEVKLISSIVRSSSEFFEKTFQWQDRKNDETIVEKMYEIDLTHVDYDLLELVIVFLHSSRKSFTSKFESLAQDNFSTDVTEYINWVLSLIELSDELLLFDLKNFLEAKLCNELNSSNALILFRHAVEFKCDFLMENSLWILFHNMSHFLFDEGFSELVNENNHEILKKMNQHWKYFDELRKKNLVNAVESKRKRNIIDEAIKKNSDLYFKLFINDKDAFNDIYNFGNQFEAIFEFTYHNAPQQRKPSVSTPSEQRTGMTAQVTAQSMKVTATSSSDDDESAITDGPADDFIPVMSSRRRRSSARNSKQIVNNNDVGSTMPLKTPTAMTRPYIVEPSPSARMRKYSIPIDSPSPALTPAAALPSPSLANIRRTSESAPIDPIAPSPIVQQQQQQQQQALPKVKINVKKPSQRERKQLAQLVSPSPMQQNGSGGDASSTLSEPSSSSRNSSRSETPIWNIKKSASTSSTTDKRSNKTNGNDSAATGAVAIAPPPSVIAQALASAEMSSSPSSLSAIMNEQESRIKKQGGDRVKPEKTLQEIQEEEEFLKWFNEESARIQESEKRQQKKAIKISKKHNKNQQQQQQQHNHRQ